MKSTMPAPGPRFALALGDNLGLGAQRVAVEHRVGEFHVGHAEIADGRAERGVADGDADHQAEREELVDQRLAPLGLGRELGIEMQRLRIVGQAGEQHVVHLGDGPRDRVLEHSGRSRTPRNRALPLPFSPLAGFR